ncbi:MAG: hypothetical protein KJO75_07965 [Dactylosporangium sp.]|nr:hypothetical protein [Dactylosporangium sp.]
MADPDMMLRPPLPGHIRRRVLYQLGPRDRVQAVPYACRTGLIRRRRVSGMQIEHVAVWTPDLERLREFYTAQLGATAGPRYVSPRAGSPAIS